MGRRTMETKLKAQWSFVIVGFLCAVLGLAIFHTIQTYASKDSRVKKDESREVAGIKNDVPLSREMSEALKRKEIELNEQEQRIKDESERLKIEEAKIKSRIDELLEIQAKLEKSKKEDQKLAEDTKAKLLKTFEKIQPKKAAAIITNMEDDVAVSILKNLKEKQKCKTIFLSPIFYNEKYSKNKILNIIKFNLITLNWKNNIGALGGIKFKNLKLINLTRSKSIGVKSLVTG